MDCSKSVMLLSDGKDNISGTAAAAAMFEVRGPCCGEKLKVKSVFFEFASKVFDNVVKKDALKMKNIRVTKTENQSQKTTCVDSIRRATNNQSARTWASARPRRRMIATETRDEVQGAASPWIEAAMINLIR